jgi:hypothetical protein
VAPGGLAAIFPQAGQNGRHCVSFSQFQHFTSASPFRGKIKGPGCPRPSPQ